jgi:hypothetical protein
MRWSRCHRGGPHKSNAPAQAADRALRGVTQGRGPFTVRQSTADDSKPYPAFLGRVSTFVGGPVQRKGTVRHRFTTHLVDTRNQCQPTEQRRVG